MTNKTGIFTMKFIDSERCRIGAEFSYERRDIFRMSDSHWIVWNLFLCNWNIFWIMSSRTRFFGFIPWDKSSSKHTVLWWLFVVNILINDIVSGNNIISNRPNNLEDFKTWSSSSKSTYRAAPGVRAKSWSNEPILRLEVILYALEAGFDGIFGPISCGKE